MNSYQSAVAMILLVVLFLSVAALGHTEITVEDCPHELYKYGNLRAFDHSCYVFFADYRRDFGQAERFCERDGGHLATIRDLRTQNFLYKIMRRDFRYRGKVWIGLTDYGREDHFYWTDGSSASYTNWASGQPSLLSGILQNCVYMDTYREGRWYDERCTSSLFHSSRYPFICEYALRKRTTPTNTTTTTTSSPTTTTTTTTAATTTTLSTTLTPTTTTPTPTLRLATTRSVPNTTTTIPQKTTTTTTTTTLKPQHPPTTTTSSQPRPTTTTTLKVASTTTTTTSTTHPKSTVSQTTVTKTGRCPAFNCFKYCGMYGYKIDGNGCLLCQCAP